MAGLLLLPLVARSLPSQQLGLWYVFVSLQGIVYLFDIGFNPTVTRSAGYIWGGARRLQGMGLEPLVPTEGALPNYPLLNELIATMRAYYRVFGAIAAILMLFAGGYWILHKTDGLPDAKNLRLCYVIFALGTVLNATGDLWPALLAGVNAVRQSERLLFGSILINYLVVGTGILTHLGLWAMVLGTLLSGLFLRIAGRRALVKLLANNYDVRCRASLAIVKTLWPMAWRTGIVSVGTFFVLSANTLICSAYLSLQVTASYGLTLNLIAILTYVSTVITQIKVPLVNQLRIKGDTPQIVDLWIHRTRLSIVVYVAGATFILAFGDTFLRAFGAQTTLLPTAQLALLFLVLGLIMHHVLYAFLVVSENQNPFVWPALISGGATILVSFLLTPRVGIWGMLLAQGIVQASFSNWWTVYRGIRGLGLSGSEYWQRYFRLPVRI